MRLNPFFVAQPRRAPSHTRLRGAMQAEAETFYDLEEETDFAAPIFPIKAPRPSYRSPAYKDEK